MLRKIGKDLQKLSSIIKDEWCEALDIMNTYGCIYCEGDSVSNTKDFIHEDDCVYHIAKKYADGNFDLDTTLESELDLYKCIIRKLVNI